MDKKRRPDFKFTVVAGKLKGKVITAPNLGVTRPPLTRLRKAVFDFLTPYLESAHYLDLFSGSGSYLFEAISRGVGSALGVEIEKQLAAAINQQAERLHVRGQLLCLCDDVFRVIPRLASQKRRFDIIMIAPPQYAGLIDKTLLLLRNHRILNKGGLIICQHDTSETPRVDFAGIKIEQQRKYGNTTFTVCTSLTR